MDHEPVFPDLLHSHQGEHTADLEPKCCPAVSNGTIQDGPMIGLRWQGILWSLSQEG
jgi:hypothetical protein